MTKILIIGEAYGMREMLFEHPFVGASGVELSRMLSEAELAPGVNINYPTEKEMIAYWQDLRKHCDIAITNVFNRQPMNNNILEFFTSAKEGLTHLPPLTRGKFLKPEYGTDIETLWQTINTLKPNLILALGNIACWATLGQGKISTIRGTIKVASNFNIKVLPTFHPAAVLRQYNLRPIVIKDLLKAYAESATPEVQRIKRWLTVNPTLDEIRAWMERPADYYACDIETSVVIDKVSIYIGKQITMIGFARSSHDGIVIPFIDPTKDNWSYWSNSAEEIEAWKLVIKILRSNVPKVFQNGVFDISRLVAIGIRPNNCRHDSMLLHHALYPEMLKGLGFLGSIYSQEIAWKDMRTAGNNLKRDE